MAKKQQNYIRCALERNGQSHMAFIPEKFAVKGKFIKILEQDGWEVTAVSDCKLSREEAEDFSQTKKSFGQSIKPND